MSVRVWRKCFDCSVEALKNDFFFFTVCVSSCFPVASHPAVKSWHCSAFLSSGVQVQVNKVAVLPISTEVELSCLFSCASPARLSYVWFKNGQKTGEETPRYRDYLQPGDNVSCALKGHEGYGSPAVCELNIIIIIISHSGLLFNPQICSCLSLQTLHTFPLCRSLPLVRS